LGSLPNRLEQGCAELPVPFWARSMSSFIGGVHSLPVVPGQKRPSPRSMPRSLKPSGPDVCRIRVEYSGFAELAPRGWSSEKQTTSVAAAEARRTRERAAMSPAASGTVFLRPLTRCRACAIGLDSNLKRPFFLFCPGSDPKEGVSLRRPVKWLGAGTGAGGQCPLAWGLSTAVSIGGSAGFVRERLPSLSLFRACCAACREAGELSRVLSVPCGVLGFPPVPIITVIEPGGPGSPRSHTHTRLRLCSCLPRRRAAPRVAGRALP